MVFMDVLGMALTALLGIGLIGSLVDLLIKISRQPKKDEPADWTAMSPYPLVAQVVRTDEYHRH
jgi:hypothetical protein